MSVAAPAITSPGGVYQVIGANGNMDSGFYAFHTSASITRITFEHYLNTGSRLGSGGGGIAIKVDQGVPEPGTWGMMFVGGAGLAWANRQRRLRSKAL